ncbi:unnamed protein product [Ambrosiozyma monospora]|uniref:Unnamed protein product n=1 Tax=Ambrosiozyma monospora TaxID=43982 RepID=A0A9W6Z0Q1_AMBMO|nr:unnamed protein product [Ambrosiozyma monospora]
MNIKTILISIVVILMSLFLKSIISKQSTTTTTTAITQLKRNISTSSTTTTMSQPQPQLQPEAKSNPLTFEFTTSSSSSSSSSSSNGEPASALPIFFLSHGGPTFADRDDPMGSNEGAWDETKKIGDLIKFKLKPKFIVVVSAHWQASRGSTGSGSDVIEVSVPSGLVKSAKGAKGAKGDGNDDYENDYGNGLPGEELFASQLNGGNQVSKQLDQVTDNSLIYDFYGFPARHYKSQFHTFGNLGLSQKIVEKLRNFKVQTTNTTNTNTTESEGTAIFKNAKLTTRGFDHGLWVPLRVAFGDTKVSDTQKYDVDVPMVQVSLPRSGDLQTSYRLGQALSWIRDVGGLLIFSGMSVHNLHDMGLGFQLIQQGGAGLSLSYVDPFNRILTRQLTCKLENNGNAVLVLVLVGC